ncbi:DUF2244 domain-containing protein [Tabrizicola sp. TH137]|uniref:DUF2244 domain-containing protein n=1 Tax=Tabrizicola sp. TH137 TaxID=2067452 RepID=UPI000C7D08D5|nr:DUF2244 domain-containing protein [Tabrizicola sp. TH137]PLL11604.1 DUF2244 domain-containing protein [Tabrizicola sp. TH137]
MPYEWLPTPDTAAHADDTQARLHLWPYRSLPRKGFVLFIGATCALILVPMLAVLGSPVLWGILPFFALAIWGMWAALSRSYRDAEIVEDLTLTRDALSLTRHGPRGRRQDWQANPHWVSVQLHQSGGPVPNYLTLKGNGREVELGAFLSEEERLALRDELQTRLSRLR